MYNVKQHDKEVEKMRIEIKKRKLRKSRCSKDHGRNEEGEKVAEEVIGGILTEVIEEVVGGLLGGGAEGSPRAYW